MADKSSRTGSSSTVWEVLHRRPDGHETVLRVDATSAAAAKKAAAERYGVDAETLVDAAAWPDTLA